MTEHASVTKIDDLGSMIVPASDSPRDLPLAARSDPGAIAGDRTRECREVAERVATLTACPART